MAEPHKEASLLEKLHAGAQNLPVRQRQVCDYLLNNYQQVAFLTIKEVAKQSGLSPSTIVRTAASLGFDSYHSLRQSLKSLLFSSKASLWWQMEMSWDEEQTGRLEDANHVSLIPQEENGAKVIRKSEHPLFISTRDNIDCLTQSLTPLLFENFDTAADLLEKAKRIFMLGMRSSYGIVRYGYSLFHQFMSNIYMADRSSHEEIFDDLIDLVPGDCLLAVSCGWPHYASRTFEMINAAHSMKIPIVLLTTELSNPAVPLADVVLNVTPGKNHYTMAPALTVLEALVIELGRRLKPSAIIKLRKLEDLLKEKNITL
jgi:DNA-binding MurR/RpiR family transcriptional regulator